MKVVIMAGGLGKRIANVDPTIPKPLLPISGKPILQWEIECLVRQGLNEIIITVSHMAEKIQDYFGDGTKFGCNIEYYVEKQLLGNAGALFRLWEERKLDGDFLLLNADSMFDVDFKRFIAFHEKKRDKEQGNKGQENKEQDNALATLFTHPNNHPYDSTLIVVNPETHVIKQWLTKDDDRPEFYKNCVNAGLHIINTELLAISGIKAEEINAENKIDLDRDVLKPLISSGRIYSYSSPEYVKDMGTPERLEQVKQDLISGKVQSRNLSKPQKAIFLDRDGTINKSVGFLKNIDDFELLPGVTEAIKSINSSEYLCFVVTNQPVIARGGVTIEKLNAIHNKMETLLGKAGAYIDGLYYCPHHPDKGFEGEIPELKIDCDCRKPKPGMLLQAARDYNIDLISSWMIGDSERDIKAGKNAGCKTILISSEAKNYNQNYTNDTLLKATYLIFRKLKKFSYRQLNTDYGSYFPGFFVMRLNHAIPFHNDKVEISDFTVEQFATFAHEYIHYLQDISTTRGLNSLVYVDKLLQLNFNIIATSPENVIELPLDLEKLGIKNLYGATQLESFYMGDSRPLFKINHVTRIEREVEFALEGITSEPMYDINIYFDDEEKVPYLFGRDAVAESMAYTIEYAAFKAEKRSREFPYNACELVCQQICPQILENNAVFVAMMELSLMHYHSGDMFWHLATHIRDNNLHFKSVAEFETYFLGKTNFLFCDMVNDYQEAISCIDVIYPNTNHAFDEVREFVKSRLLLGLNSRMVEGLFISKILEAKNPYQTLCDYMSKYGMPIMCDSTYGMYGTTLTGNITALLAPLALYNVFMGNGEEANGCFMYPYCKVNNHVKQCNEHECTKHPWTQADKDEREVCLFGVYWHMYSLSGKKVVRKK